MAYERIPYSSFIWKLGTTSFRTKEFNFMTEKQLALLDAFWKDPHYTRYGWENKYMFPGQEDIYWIKCRYYDWLVDHDFMTGGEPEDRKFKTAREKTSGLYDMGLINENHRLSPAGMALLALAESGDYDKKTSLGISQDSELYLQQLLKLSLTVSGNVVRPAIVTLYLLAELDTLSYDEFRYLLPLCINSFSTDYILNCIRELRKGKGSIDDIIKDFLLSKDNYKEGLKRFLLNPFSESLLLSVSMNRKSPKYDKPYVTLFRELEAVYLDKNYSRIVPLFLITSKFQSSIAIKWRTLCFDTSSTAAVKKDPLGHLVALPEEATQSYDAFRRFFYLTMHLYKAKATLEDYLDLNRRYLGLTNCFLFDEREVKLDIVPRQFFLTATSQLYEQAYSHSPILFDKSTFEDICPALKFIEKDIIDGINKDLDTHVDTLEAAMSEVDRLKYDRFNKMVDQKFNDANLLKLLDWFDTRQDENINQLVTDNADIPTIFEYILGIIWYKASDRKGKILDFLKLYLDIDLLPVTHAAGGEADIVYEYQATKDYPEHSLLLEATLADSTNQRRMEMEPVSRHLGNHLLRTGNMNSYCVFATSYLHVNVIGDFKDRKHTIYCDPQDEDKYIKGMKIMPISTNDLRLIIQNGIKYPALYKHFDRAFNTDVPHPKKWYDGYVSLENLQSGSEYSKS